MDSAHVKEFIEKISSAGDYTLAHLAKTYPSTFHQLAKKMEKVKEESAQFDDVLGHQR